MTKSRPGSISAAEGGLPTVEANGVTPGVEQFGDPKSPAYTLRDLAADAVALARSTTNCST